jgi:cell division protein FtsI/penicillin-binding protein 2
MFNETENQHRRLGLLAIALCVFAAILVARLAYWQVIRHDEMVKRANNERLTTVPLTPRRGTISDRWGLVLATNIPGYLVAAAPRLALTDTKQMDAQAKRIADKVAPILDLPVQALQQDLVKSKDAYYLLVKRQATQAQADQLRGALAKNDIHGFAIVTESMRVYPADTLFQPGLGLTNMEGLGYGGVEGRYNDQLQGAAGSLVAEFDPYGDVIALGRHDLTPPADGSDLVLTLDSAIQNKAQEVLAKTIAEWGASSGTILVMHPKTGAILASATLPTYNPNRFYNVGDSSVFVDPATSQFWEPGSIFKIITMAAGMDAQLINAQSTHKCNGQVVIDGQIIRTWNGAAHGTETMTEVLEHSCNVGAVFVANLLGPDRFYDYIQRFGFGKPTGVDLQGEVGGLLPLPGTREWQRINQATNSFGQGMGVTPMQMAAAVASVANGGLYMQPYIVQEVDSAATGRQVTSPKPLRRVISAQTARQLSNMLVDVVDQVSSPAHINGYRIAGKTGTAQVVVNGQYDPRLTITSYIGYAPADDPQVLVLIKIDKPQRSEWAQDVAAPAFHELTEWILHYLHIPPNA